jgi:DNA excision repair protein ERCC-4
LLVSQIAGGRRMNGWWNRYAGWRQHSEVAEPACVQDHLRLARQSQARHVKDQNCLSRGFRTEQDLRAMEIGRSVGGEGTDHRTRIVADDREAGSPVVAVLRTRGDIDLAVQRMTVGDYEVGGCCLIERKTIRDFGQSLVDGRLFRQAYRLRATGWPCALILEGRLADLIQVQVRRECIQGALITLSLGYGIPTLRALDAEETARLLVYAAGQLERDAVGSAVMRKPRCSQRRRTQLYVLRSLPGIGPKRAVALLDRFGSVRAVLNASQDDLSAVPGMGPGVIQKLEWAIG